MTASVSVLLTNSQRTCSSTCAFLIIVANSDILTVQTNTQTTTILMNYTSHYFLLALAVAVYAWITTTFFLAARTRPNMALRLQMNVWGFCSALIASSGVPVLLANLRLETIDIWIATMLIWFAAIACVLLLSS